MGALGVVPDPKRYDPLYQVITALAVSSRIQGEDGLVDSNRLDAVLDQFLTTEEDALLKPLFRRFLYDDYVVEAWYQRRL